MSMKVDIALTTSLGETDVDKDPILVLSCGHAFTMATLDGMMEMSTYYKHQIDPVTRVVNFNAKRPLPSSIVKLISCPTCQQPILKLLRYGRRIKNTQLRKLLEKRLIYQENDKTVAEDLLRVARMEVMRNRKTFQLGVSITPAYSKFAPPESALRRLGKFAHELDAFPITDFFTIAETYSIPIEHRQQWMEHMQPVVVAIKKLNNVNKNAAKSPTMEMFEAAFSHLCQLKVADETSIVGAESRFSEGVDADPLGSSDAWATITERIIECGLPADGYAGSYYIASLVGKTDALLLVLSEAISAMESIGPFTGWYWFVEDLRNCCLGYIDIAMEAAVNGLYYHRAAHLRMALLNLLCDQVRWLGLRPLSDDEDAQDTRVQHVGELLKLFLEELKELQENCPTAIKEEYLARATMIKARLFDEVKIVLGELTLSHRPSTLENIQVVHAISSQIDGPSHWLRCPNGHIVSAQDVEDTCFFFLVYTL